MASSRSILVVGAGIFGVAAALELRRRGHDVRLIDPGPLPHPDAASTDVSKVIRMDYGADAFYVELMEEAFKGWDAWNRAWDPPLYHETGFLIMTREEMRPGTFEHDSYALLRKRGHALSRIDARELKERFGAWNAAGYPDGYLNPRAGWAESGRVVARLIEEGRAAGVRLMEGRGMAGLIEKRGRVGGIVDTLGEVHEADFVVAAMGAWTPRLLPHLASVMSVVGQPVFHFLPADPSPFRAEVFPTWAADISRTGWYGFPALPDGRTKVANHGPGRPVDPSGPRDVLDSDEAAFRAFLAGTFPALAEAPVVAKRLCLYCDAWDGDFYIDHDPAHPGLVLATGGSGHGFKFAPVLGRIIADVLEGALNKFAFRFLWRERRAARKEDARNA